MIDNQWIKDLAAVDKDVSDLLHTSRRLLAALKAVMTQFVAVLNGETVDNDGSIAEANAAIAEAEGE